MRKIKIAMVAPYPAQIVLDPEKIKPTHRGRTVHAAPWVRSLTTELAKRDDVEFCVFTHSRAVSRVERGVQNGVSYVFIPQYEPGQIGCWHLHLPARIQFRQYIKKYAPDLVHGFGMESAYGLIASEQGVPGIIFIQGIQSELAPYYDQFSSVNKKLRQKLEKQVVRKINGLVAETAFGERWVRKMNPEVKVSVIPHAVNPEFFETNTDYSKNECLCVGTISRIKGVDTAIRALSVAQEKSLQLSILGDGPLMSDMKKLADEMGVADRVSFCGHLSRAQVVAKMARARMLVILSRMDTSPNILTEAHAAGLPVIGTRAGGIPDMIEEGKDGFLVDVDDFQTAAEKMDMLASNISLCRQLGAAGRKKVKRLNDPCRIAELHLQFYHEILGS